MPAPLVLLACLSLIAPRLQGATHCVDVHAEPGTQRELSVALAAAADGDTIVVRPGTYEQPVVVDGKSLTIVAAGAAPLFVEPFIVRNLADGQSVVLDGLRLEPGLRGPGLTVEHCQGAVLVRDSTLCGPLVPAAPTAAVRLTCSAAVVLRRCRLRGSRAVGLDAGPGLRLDSGRVSVLDCDVEGGGGMVVGGSLRLPGGAGAEVCGGELLVVGGSLRGGPGGDGRFPPGVSGGSAAGSAGGSTAGSAGGPGLVVHARGRGAARLAGVTPEGGAGGRAAARHPAGVTGLESVAPPGSVERLAITSSLWLQSSVSESDGATTALRC